MTGKLLAEASTAELREALARRIRAEAIQRNEKRQQRRELLLAMQTELLPLVEHEGSCTDTKPLRGDALIRRPCARCVLLELGENHGYNPGWMFRIEMQYDEDEDPEA